MYQHGILEVGLNLIKTLISLNAAVHNSIHGKLWYVLLFVMYGKFSTFAHITLFHGSKFYIPLEMLHGLIIFPQMVPLSALSATYWLNSCPV